MDSAFKTLCTLEWDTPKAEEIERILVLGFVSTISNMFSSTAIERVDRGLPSLRTLFLNFP